MIRITASITLDEREIQEDFVRASGPGGQNVNKVSTAVQLRFDVARSPSLPETVRARLSVLAGRRLTNEGVLIIEAERFRSQKSYVKVTEASLTYVAIDDAGRPRKIEKEVVTT